jgi:hypothetical protein
MAALGYVLQRTVLQRTLGISPLPSLLVTFGLSIIIQNVLLLFGSADQQRLTLGGIDTASVTLPLGITVGVFPLGVFVLAVVILGVLSWVTAKTQYGRLVRAVSDDPDTVMLQGANPKVIYGIATAIAFGVVAIAGVAAGIQTSFIPSKAPVERTTIDADPYLCVRYDVEQQQIQPLRLVAALVGGPLVVYAASQLPASRSTLRTATTLTGLAMTAWTFWVWSKADREMKTLP